MAENLLKLSERDKLLKYIMKGHNKKAKAMLTPDLAKSWGMLLHCAVSHDNDVITQHLITLGSRVDFQDNKSLSTLAKATLCNSTKCVKFLLDAGAKIDILDCYGEDVLQTVFNPDSLDKVNPQIIEMLVRRVQRETVSTAALAKRLFEAKCTLPHVAHMRDYDIMASLLKCGADINERIPVEDEEMKTALHIATELNDINLVKWLINNGADVNVFDERYKVSPLFNAVFHANVAMVEFLLEQGANPNQCNFDGETTLNVVFNNKNVDKEEQFDECLKLLLQHGAIFRTSTHPYSSQALNHALNHPSSRRIDYLMAHLVMLHMLGTAVPKCDQDLSYDQRLLDLNLKLKNIRYKECERVLKNIVFEKLSLFDLLTKKEREMTVLVRKETFMTEIENGSFICELRNSHPYYYDTLMKPVAKAVCTVKLEDQGIQIICELFDADYNEFYIFANQVVSYLTEHDLHNLSQIII